LIWFVICGGLVGLGVAGLGSSLIPARASLAVELARLEGHEGPSGPGLGVRVGEWLAGVLFHLGRNHSMAADLAITGRDSARWGASAATSGAFLGGAGLLAWVLADFGGLHVEPLLAGGAVVVLAGFGILGSLSSLWAEAARRRAHFTRAVTLWLRLTNLAMAANLGLDQAAQAATEIGRDWAMAEVRQALVEANMAGRPLWVALAELGRCLEVPLLVRVSGSLQLAGTEGARLRQALQATAASARDAEMAEFKAEANRVTQQLFGPAIVVSMGYLIFLGAPALALLGGALGF
jgi:tight adherence protein C